MGDALWVLQFDPQVIAGYVGEVLPHREVVVAGQGGFVSERWLNLLKLGPGRAVGPACRTAARSRFRAVPHSLLQSGTGCWGSTERNGELSMFLILSFERRTWSLWGANSANVRRNPLAGKVGPLAVKQTRL